MDGHRTLDQITARRLELMAGGLGEIGALRQAVDEIIGEARKAGEARRAARRRGKFGGVDPVPEHRLSPEQRAEKVAEVKEARREFLAKQPSVKRRRRGNRNANQWRKTKAKRKAMGGGKGLARVALEARRVARWQKFAAELYGVSSWRYVPKKSRDQLTDPVEAAKIERALVARVHKPRTEKITVRVTDYSGEGGG